jgi:hypothetical protein
VTIGFDEAYRIEQQGSEIAAEAAAQFAQQVTDSAIAVQARRLAAPDVSLTQTVGLQTSEEQKRLTRWAIGGLVAVGIAWWVLRSRS